MAMGVTVSDKTVFKLMHQAGIYGLPGPGRTKRLRGVVTADDLVNRKFARPRPNELWVTDITQRRTREGWVYCAAVLDAYSRRIIGWSIGLQAGHHARHQRARHGHPEPSPRAGRDRSCGSWHPIHLVTLRGEDPLRRVAAVVRVGR